MDYGDIMRVETSGASGGTARQDGLTYSGVRASHKMADTDAGRMDEYKSIIKRVGAQKGISPALIAAIISRESRAGNILTAGGWGDHGNAFGLMQVDKRWHTPKGEWESEEHISQATDILIHFIGKISESETFDGCSLEEKLKGGIAAYNTGAGNVESYENVDANTTGRDYSNDVVARAQWYSKNGYKG